MYDVAIIGSGPAGLSASLYTVRAGLSTHVYTGTTMGGLVTTTELVDNYLGLPGIEGPNMAKVFLEHAEKLGVELVKKNVETVEKLSDGTFLVEDNTGEKTSYRTVIFAAGSIPRKLEVPGESLEGVSWCATCDGAFSAGEDVIVVGGGESAVEEAIYMSNIAANVTVLLRGETFRATAPAVENLVSRENVTVRYNSQIQEIIGEDAVEAVHLTDGARIESYAVFEAIGQIPQSSLAEAHSTLYSDGFVKHSDTEGFFVAGDICNPEHRQIAVAVGDGAKAGMAAVSWLQTL